MEGCLFYINTDIKHLKRETVLPMCWFDDIFKKTELPYLP